MNIYVLVEERHLVVGLARFEILRAGLHQQGMGALLCGRKARAKCAKALFFEACTLHCL